MIKELTQYVENQGLGTIGTDLFAGFRPGGGPGSPEAADQCVVLMERTGEIPNFYLSDTFDKPIQVLSRSTTYHTARDDIIAVLAVLEGKSNAGLTLPVIDSGDEYYINAAELLSGPYWLGQDEKGRHEFSANLVLHVKVL